MLINIDEKLIQALDEHYYMICRYYKGNCSLAKRKGIYDGTVKRIKQLFPKREVTGDWLEDLGFRK